jgi:hypothetical protein
MVLERVGERRDVRKVFDCTRVRLASDIFREVAEEHVDWPHLSCSEGCKMCSIRPEHEACDDLLPLARRIVS